MTKLQSFMNILTGSFHNMEQYTDLKNKGVEDFPYAEHVNTVCNDKIKNLPADFGGIFLIEESRFKLGEKTHHAPHLFLFTEEEEGIKLTSYEIPKGYTKDTFSYENLTEADYLELELSEKFTPAIFTLKDGIWEGGSVSMFSPVLKFTLSERFSEEQLEVSETMEVNGKRTFGYDEPIIYKRC